MGVSDLRAYLRARPLLADAVGAAILLVLVVATNELLAAVLPLRMGAQPHGWTAPAWAALGLAPLVLRRRAPWVAVGATVALTVVAALAGWPLLAQGVTVICLSYTAAAHQPLRWAILANALLWVSSVFAPRLLAPHVEVPVLYTATGGNILIAWISFFVGRTAYNRRRYAQALAEQARSAAEGQRALTDQAIADERRRIARELHDVVAHHVSVMGVLATGARRALARDPEAADEALGTIEETGRTTLREMRRLLDVLRTAEEPEAELHPQPDLAGVVQLAEQIRDAGLPVSLKVDGEPVPLDPGVALTVYRIVQEALTNALKHAGSATAEVRLSFGRYFLAVEVCDTGRGPRPGGGSVGHGLLGMRERVALYGGTLRTGARPGGGYRVHARLPIEAGDGTA